MSKLDRGLFISDLQIPFEAEHALKFCQAVEREFKIPKNHIYCVGDELDLYWGSFHKKDPDAELTPKQELLQSRKKLKEWYKVYPEMKVAISNHGLRWLRKAVEAEIPTQLIKCYREIIDAPKGWQWRERWNIEGEKARIAMIHGLGYSGMYAHRKAAMDLGCNVIHGHLHSHAGIAHIQTDGRRIWGMNTGCLIDPEAFAFNYGRWNAQKPVLGVGVVIDGGLTPILIPYERFL